MIDGLSLVVAAIALVVPVIGLRYYLKHRQQDELNRQQDELNRQSNVCKDRIDKLVELYLGLVTSSKDSGFSALFKSGVKNLQDDSEIDDAISQIIRAGSKSPLGKYEPEIREYGLHKFFARTNREDLVKNSPTELIKKYIEEEKE